MAETFQPIRAPVCRVIMDLAERRKAHQEARRTAIEATTQDLKDSWLLEQDKKLVIASLDRLSKRTSEAFMQSFVQGVLVKRSWSQ